ncbi:hypothetical protein K438DRAFT_1751402 [Mycena galopus ATCC 62051]|nr:hypothetical protein K438DRAFT_1751402 [Mycena galopus ATCC 62051]
MYLMHKTVSQESALSTCNGSISRPCTLLCVYTAHASWPQIARCLPLGNPGYESQANCLCGTKTPLEGRMPHCGALVPPALAIRQPTDSLQVLCLSPDLPPESTALRSSPLGTSPSGRRKWSYSCAPYEGLPIPEGLCHMCRGNRSYPCAPTRSQIWSYLCAPYEGLPYTPFWSPPRGILLPQNTKMVVSLVLLDRVPGLHHFARGLCMCGSRRTSVWGIVFVRPLRGAAYTPFCERDFATCAEEMLPPEVVFVRPLRGAALYLFLEPTARDFTITKRENGRISVLLDRVPGLHPFCARTLRQRSNIVVFGSSSRMPTMSTRANRIATQETGRGRIKAAEAQCAWPEGRVSRG